jgi:RecA-family ATPase
MLERTYPTPKWLIKDLIPEGLVFFAGSPKSSKTYLAYSLALSLVLDTLEDEPWLGQYPILNAGPVVYFTLEDDEGDSWMRIKELMPGLTTMDRNRFVFHHGYDLPPLGPEFVRVLEEQVIATYAPSLIVLDPLSYLYPPTMKGVDQFGEVKNMLLPLRWLGKEHHCTILGIDHRRKKSADDVDIFETTYGSNAKPAIADSMLMVIREAEEVTLHARVRKAADQTLTLAFTFDEEGRAHWEWKGAVDGLLGQGKYGELRFKVLEALSGYGGPMSTSDILAALDIPESIQMKANLRKVLWRAERDGEVQKTKRGSYVWAGGR